MSKLLNCGYCCLIISIWGTLQLTIMGIAYNFEVVTLFNDVEPHSEDYETYAQFIDKVRENYSVTSLNCFYGGLVYLCLIFMSLGCIHTANKKLKQKVIITEDDDAFCTPKGFY